MTTEAGKRLLADAHYDSCRPACVTILDAEGFRADLAAIEAEAAATERALYSGLVAEAFENGGRAALTSLRERVAGLYGELHPMAAIEDEPTRHDVVSRKAVLAEIDRALE